MPNRSTSSTARTASSSGSAAASTTRRRSPKARPRSSSGPRRCWPACSRPTSSSRRRTGSSSRRSSATGSRAPRSPTATTSTPGRSSRRPRTTPCSAPPIVLPEHPRIAPESLGNLFDNTEIEEALMLHVHALSDDEREAIAAQDPAVREMIEKAAATTPEEMISLHGRDDAGRADRGPGLRHTSGRSPRLLIPVDAADAARPRPGSRARPPEPGRGDAGDRRQDVPQGRQGDPAARHRPRRPRHDDGRADGDDRAPLHRLRGRRPRRGDDRRRPGAGAVPRDRPLPLLQGRRARAAGSEEVPANGSEARS